MYPIYNTTQSFKKASDKLSQTHIHTWFIPHFLAAFILLPDVHSHFLKYNIWKAFHPKTHTRGLYPCPGMHSEPWQHLGLPLAYTTQGIPRAQSHKSQLRGYADCMSSVNSTTSRCSKPELTQRKEICLLRGPLMLGCVLPCGWSAWSVACTLLRGDKMQSIMGVLRVGNSSLGQLLWFLVSLVPRYCWRTAGSWEGVGRSMLPLRASVSQAGSGR